MSRTEVPTDEMWSRIEPLLPALKGAMGKVDDAVSAAVSTVGSRSDRAPPPSAGTGERVRFVVGVEGSVDQLFQKGVDLGGTLALQLADMQGIGRVGYLLDPDGNVFALISPVLSDGTDVMME